MVTYEQPCKLLGEQIIPTKIQNFHPNVIEYDFVIEMNERYKIREACLKRFEYK